MSQKLYLPLSIFSLVFLLVIIFMPTTSLWVTDEGIKSIYSQSLSRNHFQSTAIEYPGHDVDPAGLYSPLLPPEFLHEEGQFYSIVHFLYPFCNALLMKLYGFGGINILSSLAFALIFLLLNLALTRNFAAENPTWGALFICLGTPLFFYGITAWEYELAAFLTLLGFYLMSQGEKSERNISYFLAGISYGLGVWWREEVYLITFAFFLVYFFQGQRKSALLLQAIGMFIALLPLWLAQSILGEGILGRHLGAYLAEKGRLSWSLAFWLKLKIGASWLFAGGQNVTLNWLLAALLLVPLVFSFLTKNEKIRLAAWSAVIVSLTLYTWQLLTAFDYFFNIQYANGLFFTAPLLLFALSRETSPNANLIRQLRWGSLLSIVLIILAANPKSGRGMHWGARHLLPLYPLLGLLAWEQFSRLFEQTRQRQNKLLLGLISLILFFSLSLQAFSGVLWGLKKYYGQEVRQALLADKSPYIITGVWWLPVEMSSIFYQKKFFYVDNLAKLELIKKRIAQVGGKEFLYVTSPHYSKNVPSDSLLAKWGVTLQEQRRLRAPRMTFLDLSFYKYRISN